MEKIVIIGGGISGLTARYRLSKRYPRAEIVLYEKSSRIGGCIGSAEGPYFFESGPRTIKASRSRELLQLIEELDLQSEILYSSPHARKRFLCVNGKLRSLSSFIPALVPAHACQKWRRRQ